MSIETANTFHWGGQYLCILLFKESLIETLAYHTHSNERASDQTNNQTTPSTSFAHPVEHPRTKLTNGKDGERKQISGLQNYYSYNFHKSGCRKNVCVCLCVCKEEKKSTDLNLNDNFFVLCSTQPMRVCACNFF